MQFTDFGFEPTLLEGIEAMGFTNPTPIQEMAIPLILNRKDLIACAQTGTGKTAAFLLPVMNSIIRRGHGSINTLILVPTRELAVQIENAIQGLAYFTNISGIAVYGGNDGQMFEQEKRAIQTGADIIVATPGRLISHLTGNHNQFRSLQHLILDEADRMLDMGFHDAIMRILSFLPQQRQTLMFSATMPPKIRTLAKKLLSDPEQINIALSKPAEGVSQEVYYLHDQQKLPLLKHIISSSDYTSILIFASTREMVKNLERDMQRQGFQVAAIHSDLEQTERKEVLRQFSNKNLRILIATDILSRGIDVDNIDLVVNYQVPGDPEDYIHRVGRTARAASKGHAITFTDHKDNRKFKNIEELIGYKVAAPELPEPVKKIQSTSPPQQQHRRPNRNFNRGRGGRR